MANELAADQMLADDETIAPRLVLQWARDALMALAFIRREGDAGRYIPKLENALQLVRGRFAQPQDEPFPPIALTLAMDRIFPLEDPPLLTDLQEEAGAVAAGLQQLIEKPHEIHSEVVSSLEDFFRQLVLRAVS
jgi:hypothetical protein